MSNQKSRKVKAKKALPPIPDKIYFTIGEVAELCDLRPHVLRYWEQEFESLAPTKRRGNRRYYQHKDVSLIRKIRHLLYDDGYTIEGARQKLQGESVEHHKEQKVFQVVRASVAELERTLTILEEPVSL